MSHVVPTTEDDDLASPLDPYKALGVKRNATAAQITSAFRKLVKRHHPDAGGNPAKFARLMRAYDVLRDPELKARYDETGALPSENPNNDIAEAYNILTQAFDAVLQSQGIDLERTDLIQAIRQKFSEAKKGRSAQGPQIAQARKALLKVQKRITPKGTRPNVFAQHVAAKIAALDKQIEIMKRTDEIEAIALKMLNDYVCAPGAPIETIQSFTTQYMWTS